MSPNFCCRTIKSRLHVALMVHKIVYNSAVARRYLSGLVRVSEAKLAAGTLAKYKPIFKKTLNNINGAGLKLHKRSS